MRNCRYLSIKIPIKPKGNNSFENIRKAEQTLGKRGIHFDQGLALALGKIKFAEWNLDWSLTGARPETVLKFLKEQKIKANVRCVKP